MSELGIPEKARVLVYELLSKVHLDGSIVAIVEVALLAATRW